jgi:hypothetical protein
MVCKHGIYAVYRTFRASFILILNLVKPRESIWKLDSICVKFAYNNLLRSN